MSMPSKTEKFTQRYLNYFVRVTKHITVDCTHNRIAKPSGLGVDSLTSPRHQMWASQGAGWHVIPGTCQSSDRHHSGFDS